MDYFKSRGINEKTILIVPIDAEISLSTIIDYYNMHYNNKVSVVIIDTLIYVGNRKNRFKICQTDNGRISMTSLKTYIPNETLVDMSSELFSKVSMGIISKIICPSIRNSILKKKLKRNI